MAAIAAALPCLHTLSVFAFPSCVATSAVAGFFEDLLPRLHVFDYLGDWPQNLDNQDVASSLCAPLPLPHLRSLKLQGFGSNPPPWTCFAGAQLFKLSTDDVMIERWLPLENNIGAASAAVASSGGVVRLCPLAAVRTLQITVRSPIAFTAANVARLLRTPRNTRRFRIGRRR
jgi:hypothetical protein